MSPIRPCMDWSGRFAEDYTDPKSFNSACCNSNKRNWSLLLVFNLSSLVSVLSWLRSHNPITRQPSPHLEQTTKLLWWHWLEDELVQWHWWFFFWQLNTFRSWMAIPSWALLQQLLANRTCSLWVFLQGDIGQRFWKTGKSMWGMLVHHTLHSQNERPGVCPSASDGRLWQVLLQGVWGVWRKIRTFCFHVKTKACQHASIKGGKNKPWFEVCFNS